MGIELGLACFLIPILLFDSIDRCDVGHRMVMIATFLKFVFSLFCFPSCDFGNVFLFLFFFFKKKKLEDCDASILYFIKNKNKKK